MERRVFYRLIRAGFGGVLRLEGFVPTTVRGFPRVSPGWERCTDGAPVQRVVIDHGKYAWDEYTGGEFRVFLGAEFQDNLMVHLADDEVAQLRPTEERIVRSLQSEPLRSILFEGLDEGFLRGADAFFHYLTAADVERWNQLLPELVLAVFARGIDAREPYPWESTWIVD